VIQTTNNDNVMSHAHCFYTDGQRVNGLPRWSVTDFRLTLTRQQTTTWSACSGRPVNARDDQNGLDPGFVPPVLPGFTGSLVCVQTDITGAPNGGEDLTGRADVSGAGYNAVGIRTGTVGDNGDNVLDLDGLEYEQCPSSYHLNFATNGTAGAVALGPMDNAGLDDAQATVSTSVTVVPCSFDFANLIPARVTIGYDPIVDRKVAIKVAYPAEDDDNQARVAKKMFLNEAQTAGSLDHPNILKVYDAG
jgi:serine/threonine protein kinase